MTRPQIPVSRPETPSERKLRCFSMTEKCKFFSVETNTMNPCSMTHEARDAAKLTWACPGGPHPKPGTKAIDVWIQGRRPSDKPLNFVMFGGVPVVHRELLAMFGEDNVARDLYIGRVFSESGKEVPDWVTARGRNRLIIRGTADVSYHRCPDCGCIFYFATGNQYLFPRPPRVATIFESDSFGFVVPRDIAERVAAIKWRRMSIEPLPILDPPPDSLGILPGPPRD